MKRAKRGASATWLAGHIFGASPDECLIWPFKVNDGGYGLIGFGGRVHRAHRLAWELWNDQQATPGMVIMHSCDNPPCVNPYHLSLGTKADNMADCVAKGRQARGERQGHAKLTAGDVLAIRAASGRLHEIAGKYGVSLMTVSDIKRRTRWRWLTSPEDINHNSTRSTSNGN